MERNRHHRLSALAGLLALSCLVQVVVVHRATVPALDSVRFVDMAQSIGHHGLLPAVRAENEQPLFPACVWAVHGALERATGGFPSIWAASAQWAAAIPLVLTLIPLYLLARRLVGPPAALAAAAFFCFLPECSRLGADGISDSTHLLFLTVALWGIVEYFSAGEQGGEGHGSWFRVQDLWLAIAGVATGLGLLARVEVLVLAVTLVVALAAFQIVDERRQTTARLGVGLACYLLGLTAVLGPYLAAADALTPGAAAARILGRQSPEAVDSATPRGETADFVTPRGATPLLRALQSLARDEPLSFDAKDPTVATIRRRGWLAAGGEFAKGLADAFNYWIGALALYGAGQLRRHPTTAAQRFVQVFFALFSLAALAFVAKEGYVAPRHLLALVVAGLGSAGYGAMELGRTLQERGIVKQRALAAVVAIAAAAACLPQTLVGHHANRLGHRAAGEWLAAQTGNRRTVLDTRGWTGLYSGRPTYLYEQGAAALCDPQLGYLVMEDWEAATDSPRGRTLRRLIEAGGRRAAVFLGPAAAGARQRGVVVYEWHPAGNDCAGGSSR